jgi:nondiscriminating glutamyl-tRNA synthetase
LENDEMNRTRVRFAPSPTGKLHLGSARTALFNWLFARGRDGALVLRLEDTDSERSSLEFEHDILDTLRWMGIDWDEGPDVGGDHGPYRQSERMDLYTARALELLQQSKAYRCFCTSEELDARKKAAMAAGKPWRYDRRCLSLPPGEANKRDAGGEPFTLRFKVPEGKVTVRDMLRGDVVVDASEIDDFIIMRSDGTAGFHLAVVVDDMSMEISHIIRGDDHLTNAVRHVLLFEALGAIAPLFLHHSLLMGPDGAKLSKRHGSTSVSDYRAKGYMHQALVNYLALLSWSPGDDREIFTMPELVHEFDVSGVSASKAIFDFDKLNWLNRQHMRTLSSSEITSLVEPFLDREGRSELLALPRDRLELAVESVRNNMETLVDAIGPTDVYTQKPGELSEKAVTELKKSPEVEEAMRVCIDELRSHTGDDPATAEMIVTNLREAAKLKRWSAKAVLWPLRLGLTGLTVGPDLVYLIMFWGPGGCADRIEEAIKTLERTSL